MYLIPIYIASYLLSLAIFAAIIVKFVKPATKIQSNYVMKEEDEEELLSSKSRMCNCRKNQSATNLGWKLYCEKLSEEKMMLLQEADELRRINYELKIIIQGYDETLETLGFA